MANASKCEEKTLKKRKFCKNWLLNEKYKGWIREVPHNQYQFYCAFCDEYFSCSTSHVKRHNNSEKHSKMLSDCATKKNEKKFSRVWLESNEFKPWLEEVSNDPHKFHCNICKITCSSGLSQIRRHKNSKMHISRCGKNDVPNDYILETEQKSISINEKVAEAEVKYAALVAETNLPFQSADKFLKFFQEIGKDPLILQNMTMGRTKVSKVISNVLSPVQSNHVVESVKRNKFSVFVDETSDITNVKWMAITLKHVNEHTLDVHTDLFSLLNLDATNGSADKIFEAFENKMISNEIPLGNIIAFSSDNASVMTGNRSSFTTKLKEKCKKLISLPCPCHSVALVAHAACAELPSNVEELMQKIPTFVNNSPKRLQIFKDLQNSFLDSPSTIKKYCETRWLSRHATVRSILLNWDVLLLFLQELSFSDKSKAAESLMISMNEITVKAFFLFLNYILEILNAFNLFFQAKETRIHLLQSKSENLLQTIFNNFIDNTKLKQINLNSIDFRLKTNYKDLNDIFIGLEAEEYLQEISETDDTIKIVKEKCLNFYVAACEKICQRLPIADTFLNSLNVLSPKIALLDNDRLKSFKKLEFVANSLDNFDYVGLKKEWFSIYSDFSMDEKLKLSACSFDTMWKIICLAEQHGSTKYFHLRKLLSYVRSLPNSNADSERSFSTLTDVKSRKRNKLSTTNVSSLCMVKSALQAARVNSQTMNVNDTHLAFMSSDVLYASGNKKMKSLLNLQSGEDL